MTMTLDVELPADLDQFRLPEAVNARLHALLDRQDGGQPLTPEERAEAEGLVNLAEFLTLLRLRAERLTPVGDKYFLVMPARSSLPAYPTGSEQVASN